MAAQGMTFDSTPVQQDTHVPDSSGMTFDSAPVQQDTPATAAPVSQPSAAERYTQAVYDNTVGPVVGLVKQLKTYYDNKSALTALFHETSPVEMISDAIKDPSHPLNALGHNIVQQAFSYAQAAHRSSGDAVEATKATLQALAQGNFNQAGALGEAALENTGEAVGNSMASVLPGIGPAAAKAGTQLASGDVAGGLGSATGVIGTVLAPSIIKGAGTAIGATADAASDAANAVKGASGGVVDAAKNFVTEPSLSAAQPAMQEATTAAAREVWPTIETDSVRDLFDTLSDHIFGESKSLYSQIDNATNGAWQTNENALRAVTRAIRTATDEDDLSVAMTRQQELLSDQENILSQAQANGVPADVIDNARQTYRQASALGDLQAQVNQTVNGRTGVTEADETISPAKLLPRLNKLYDAGRLQDALGDENAQNLIRAVESAGDARAVSFQKLLNIAKLAEAGGVTTYVAHQVFGGSGNSH